VTISVINGQVGGSIGHRKSLGTFIPKHAR
jgi:hypothetical protein